MLEFIVLGEIPGTAIQISFAQYIQLLFLVVAIILVAIELRIRKVQRPHLRLQEIINRLAL